MTTDLAAATGRTASAVCLAAALALPLCARAAPPPGPAAEYAYLKSGARVPLFDESAGATPVARVAGEPIELRDLVEALTLAHETRGDQVTQARRDVGALLGRLIDVRLIATEARASGMADLPEVRGAVTAYGESRLKLDVMGKAVAHVQARPAEVERAFRARVREWKVTFALCPKEEDARALVGKAPGPGFEEAVRQAIAGGKAQGIGKPEYLPEAKAFPAVAAALRTLKTGQIGGPVAVTGGFAVVRLHGVRYPEDAAVRAQVAKEIAAPRRRKALEKYQASLVKRYAKVDDKLLKTVDFESPTPGFDALLKDRRVVARIQGEAPLTVADVAEEMKRKLYHGISQAEGRRRLNLRRDQLAQAMVDGRVTLHEARRQGLDRTPEHRRQVKQFEEQLLFNTYLEKSIVPNLTISEQEQRAYYKEHGAEYAVPEFLKLDSLGFSSAAFAQRAFEKLRGGTDYRFMATNADGQLPPEQQAIRFTGSTYTAAEFSPQLVNALAGAKAGDYRLYSEGGAHYVIRVNERIAAQQKPFEAVQEAVREALLQRKVGQAIQETSARLRQTYAVEELVARIGE